MASVIDWQTHPAIVVWTDDWGMCAWAPTREVYEKTLKEEFMAATRWSSGTLETPEDMERVFQLLESHRSGDGLPVLFEAYYIIGSPDYSEIERSDFTQYVDIGLDEGVAPGWERGNLIAKAREGIRRRVWWPEYHGRAHHFSYKRWLRRLREGEQLAREMFSHQMYVCEKTQDRVPEHEDLGEAERHAWVKVAVGRFERCFGYPPLAVRNSDEAERAWATHGLRVRVGVSDPGGANQTGKRSPRADLWYLGRAINFEPFLTADQEDILARATKQIEAEFAAGRPAFISSHRRNFAAFTPDVAENFRLWEALLAWVEKQHPRTSFLASREVWQLWETGVSARRYENTVVCRNWTTAEATLLLPLRSEEFVEAVTDLGGARVPAVKQEGGDVHLVARPGNYLVTVG